MILSLFLSSFTAHAVPVQLSQQGRLLDNSGAAITGVHNLTFRLTDSAFANSFLWQDTVSVVFDNGYYSTIIGDNGSNPLDDSLFELSPLYIELEVDSNGPLSPRQELSSAPFSRRAGTANNLDGGTANASELRVGGALIIDSAGTWVGPTVVTNWGDLVGIPADLLDGDDDTLAGIACLSGQILAWNGSAWGCADDNGLTESEVEQYIVNGPLDFATGSTMGGSDLLTAADLGTTLADLSCQNGDVAKFDAVLGWQCEIDNDTADWGSLTNIPADIADGDQDTQLSEADVESYVTNGIGAYDLAGGSTLNGQAILANSGCLDGEVLSWSTANSEWVCTSFATLIDADNDGVMSWNDCDDSDATVLSSADDADCDGALTADDCDDLDPNSNTVFSDADCDGVLTADDCDDSDSALLAISNDADCDGFLTLDDCDDNNPNLGATCVFDSCQSILDIDPSAPSGSYTINPDNQGSFDVYCEMIGSEGWTLLFSSPADNTTYGSAWDFWYQAGGTSSITSPSDTGKSEAYDRLTFTHLRLTATEPNTSEITASVNGSYTGMPSLTGPEITSCAGLEGVGRHQFTSSSNSGSYFQENYIAIVACDTDDTNLEVGTHYDAAVFSSYLNHGDYDPNYSDIGSENRTGGATGDSTSSSSNILSVWAR